MSVDPLRQLVEGLSDGWEVHLDVGRCRHGREEDGRLCAGCWWQNRPSGGRQHYRDACTDDEARDLNLPVGLDRRYTVDADEPSRRWRGRAGTQRKVVVASSFEEAAYYVVWHWVRDRVRRQLRLALRAATVTRPARCDRCGASGPVDAHHRDYHQPLEVEWLCRSCHASVHDRWWFDSDQGWRRSFRRWNGSFLRDDLAASWSPVMTSRQPVHPLQFANPGGKKPLNLTQPAATATKTRRSQEISNW